MHILLTILLQALAGLGTCPPAKGAGPVPTSARTGLDPPRGAHWSEARAPAC